eukprot:SAG11_NODE_286_length_11220_cov_11.922399_4_plen_126_part_00
MDTYYLLDFQRPGGNLDLINSNLGVYVPTGRDEIVENFWTGEFFQVPTIGFRTSGFRYNIGPYLGYVIRVFRKISHRDDASSDAGHPLGLTSLDKVTPSARSRERHALHIELLACGTRSSSILGA